MSLIYEARGPIGNIQTVGEKGILIHDDFFHGLPDSLIALVAEDNRSNRFLDMMLDQAEIVEDPHGFLENKKSQELMPSF